MQHSTGSSGSIYPLWLVIGQRGDFAAEAQHLVAESNGYGNADGQGIEAVKKIMI